MGCRFSGPLADAGKGGGGRDQAQVSRREALRILSNYEQPITLQIDGWRGQGCQSCHTSDCSTQTERSWDTFQGIGVTAGSASRLNAYMDRPCCSHASLLHSQYRAYDYLPSFPHGLEHMSTLDYQAPELPSSVPKEQGCLFGCCSTNTDEPGSFLSQTEDEDHVPLGYLPLLHELDSGLGCTDGSFHQGELSGPETEEGLELGSPPDRISPGSSPSSQSLISSELSDSGFYSVSAGDFHHFQRLLERRMRLYRARVGGEKPERPGARLDLQSIPEASPPPGDAGPRHFRRSGSARLSRCPSGSLLAPQPGFSSCSTPSCQRRAALQQRNYSLELLNSSLQHLDRRRASHPSVNHDRASEHCRWQPGPDGPYVTREQRQTSPREPSCEERRLGGEARDRKGTAERDSDRQGGREHQCLMLSRPEDAHESWSKPAGGPYHTLDPMGSPGSTGPIGSPCSMLGPIGSPCSTLGPIGSPYSTLGPIGSPCSTLGPIGSPCSTLGPIGSPCSTRGPIGSPCSTRGPIGSPCSTRGPIGSPCSTLGPIGSPCSTLGVEGQGKVRAGRSQLLKARALRLADERSENTTDEEACEVQTGRYCSRAERRRHLLLAQEQRRRDSARGAAGPERGPSGSTVLELSHRKLSRLRSHNLLDDWTTVEELLTHGTRQGSQEVLCSPPLLHPLLSVTTV